MQPSPPPDDAKMPTWVKLLLAAAGLGVIGFLTFHLAGGGFSRHGG